MRFTVNGRQLELTAEDVRRKLRDVRPEPLHQYAIQIGLAIYPVKQAFEVATGSGGAAGVCRAGLRAHSR